MALGISIELAALDDVEVDGVTPGDCEEGQRHAHRLSCTDLISYVSEDSGNDSATADRGDEERSTTLGVATETSH